MKLLLFTVFIIFVFSYMPVAQELSYFGVQTHFGQLDRTDTDSATVIAILDSIQKAGIRTIRDEMYWSIIETAPGVFHFPKQFDFYVEQAKLRNISILLILNYNNPLYAAHAGLGITTDTNRSLFTRYCKAVINRYSPIGIKYYEIWNEPNIPQFWDPAPSAAEYAKLLKMVYPAAKQLDSSITILAGATSPAEGNPAPYIEWKTYFTQLIQLGIQSYCDGYSFHLYRVDKSPETFLENDAASLLSITGGGKKLYLTECGYHTSTAWPALSEQKQADYITRLYLLGKKIPALALISYYDFRNDGETASQPEHNYGMTYHNVTPKPSYRYYATMVKELQDKSFVTSSVQSGYYRYSYASAPEKTSAFWTTATATLKAESFGSNYLRITKSDGSFYYQYTKTKLLSVPYSSSPLYYTELQTAPALTSLAFILSPETLVVHQSVQMQVQAVTADGSTMLIENAAGSWSTPDSTFSVNSSGVVKATKAGTGTLTYTFNGITINKQFTILPSYTNLEIPAFKSGNYVFSTQNLLPETSSALVDTNFRTAPEALLLQYALKYAGIDKHKALFDFSDVNLPGEPDSLAVDIYNNGNGHICTFTFLDADGQEFSVNSTFNALTGAVGWKTVRVSMMNFGSAFTYPVKLKRIILYCVKNGGIIDSVYKGSILLDNVRIHNGITVGNETGSQLQPKGLQLFPCYPNPFNPETTISFELPDDGRVSLKLYSVLGEELATLLDNYLYRGLHKTVVNARAYASGIYICRLQTGSGSLQQKLVLIK